MMTDFGNNDLESTLIYKNVLQNMQDGVLAISSQGTIITLNVAAAKILMIDDKKYVGEHFTKIFSELLQDPRNDDLNDAMLSAIYESTVTHHKDVKYYSNGTIKDLLISSTALFVDKEGVKVKIGMILVISDITERQRLSHVQKLFGKYIDPKIAKRLMDYPEDELMKASRQQVTVSFCDMNHFTTLCETLSPAAMEKLMNLFFTKMSRSVNKNNGVIDKFIGDSVMAFWGAPFTIDGMQAIGGCHTALDQVASVEELRNEIKNSEEYKNLDINICIGLAMGELIIANVGSEDHKSFTVMGNIVNLAARLVGTNKVYGTTILVSEDVAKAAALQFIFREIDTVLVKGKEQPSIIYELIGLDYQVTQTRINFLALYASGLKAYRERHFDLAKRHFTAALDLAPADKPTQVFLERVAYLIANPPDEVWNGIWTLDRK
jgi:PAS domain S-box-containing protein